MDVTDTPMAIKTALTIIYILPAIIGAAGVEAEEQEEVTLGLTDGI